MVADLNPDQLPSLLNNPPDLEMSSKVMHSLRHSSLRLYSSFHSPHIQTTRSLYLSFSPDIFLCLLLTSAKVKEWVCWVGVWGYKVSLCLRTCINGQEDNLCHPYWFIFPWLLLLNYQDVLLLRSARGRSEAALTLCALRRVVRVESTAFPQGMDPARQWEYLPVSSLSLTSKSVNL